MNYKKVNNLTGWITGAIAYIVYLRTMEPTVSFWDCGEFLSCAYKLEVGHSPGAPFFMLLQRMFGIMAPSADQAAKFINSFSALTSGLTILFLFWTITHLAKKLVSKDSEPTSNQTLLIMGAGLVGALAYTFSDTFWFSAVEAEVYATSSFFTAITFWAVLKWENVADNKYADRWLILISYLIGLSVCVHLLNLLTIPAVAMVYYFKRYKVTYTGTIIAFFAGCVALAFVQFGIIQIIPKIASLFDIMFTNNMGMSFDTGALTFLVLLIAGLVALLFLARKKNLYLLHTGVLCVLFIIIGYSSYLCAIVRSRADVPIDMTNPDNPISFLDYVNREQFGQQPLFFGADFTAQPTNIESKGNLYSQSKVNGKDRYDVVGKKLEPVYEASDKHFFPRIYDNNDAGHVDFYRNFLNLQKGETPTSADNYKYFFGYQMNWMYWRYFMWNYAGRQNDFEGQGDPQNGNWICGIPFIDKNLRGLGDIDAMADGYKNNGASNKLYLLPFILGILGLVYQFNKDKKDGLIVLMLFFFTGAAIGIYLNMPPLQPRERDYAFAGSTYTFAIWIGLGVLMVNEWLQKAAKGSAGAVGAIVICLLAVPALMAKEEWHDHDRSHKTLAQAVARNTLGSCEPNAVLFTFGDNQTYPLWYAQEVEGYRKDVRIINTSLLGIDWYIDQLNYKINDADAVPMAWKKENYVGDHLNYIRYYNNPQNPQNKYINLSEVCAFMNSSNNSEKVPMQNGEYENYMPTKLMFVETYNKEDMVKHGLVPAADTSRISTEMRFTFPKETAYKSDLAILNIVAAVAKEGWKRPLYFDAGLRQGDYAGMGDFMKLEGTVYHLEPYKYLDSVKLNPQVLGSVDIDKSYKLFMNYAWGGADRTDVYFDEPNRHEFVTYRMDASFVANSLSAAGRKEDAIRVLDNVMKGITEKSYSYDYTAYFIAAAYYRTGTPDGLKKGKALTEKIVRNASDNLNWVLNTLDDDGKVAMASDMNQQFQIMQSLASIAENAKDTTTSKTVFNKLQMYFGKAKPYLDTKGGQ